MNQKTDPIGYQLEAIYLELVEAALLATRRDNPEGAEAHLKRLRDMLQSTLRMKQNSERESDAPASS